jgi:hypothetical protein
MMLMASSIESEDALSYKCKHRGTEEANANTEEQRKQKQQRGAEATEEANANTEEQRRKRKHRGTEGTEEATRSRGNRRGKCKHRGTEEANANNEEQREHNAFLI